MSLATRWCALLALRLRPGWALLAILLLRAAAPVMAGPGGAPMTPARDNLRDPFWPVDFVRPELATGVHVDPAAAVKIGEQEWRTAEKLLHSTIKGMSRLPSRSGKEEFLVLINGKLVGVGDTVSLSANGKTYRWAVTSISLRDGPALERMSTVPLAPTQAK